ncbi:MAG: methionyl-tRNA formyltransferase [Deltaproteobacteria bacterium]|nr:methionyl-tRNA formyltransferase [Deltaproteobacteria bacterium]
MGSPAFAVPSLRALHAAGHTVLCAVCQPDAPKDRGHRLQPPPVKEAALELGIPVRQPERVKGPRGQAFLDEVKTLGADIGVVAAYGKILPQELLDAPRAGCVNLHASLLPRFRGASPIQHAILEGDAETGVCLMRMVLELDAGGVFARARTPIRDDDTAETLSERLAGLAATLCTARLDEVVSGALVAEPQAAEGMTYAPLLTRQMGRLDLTGDAAREARRIRAMTPWPGTWLPFRGEVLKVHAARAEVGGGGAPATVLAVGDGIRVACGTGSLVVTEVQAAGKRRMHAADWARGARLQPGDMLAER